jgi:hypothetical protein
MLIDPETNLTITPAEVNSLLHCATQFLDDWADNEGKEDPRCQTMRRQWDVVRPALSTDDPQTLALYGAFFMEGLHDAGYDAVLAAWANGAVELIEELAGYAMPLYDMVRDKQKNDPGVFVYEVCAPFGHWYGGQVLSDGKAPGVMQALNHLLHLTNAFYGET